MKVTVIAPLLRLDYPTKLSHRAMIKVYLWAKKNGYDVILLESEFANPISFFSVGRKGSIVCYGGHATPVSWVGQWILFHLLAPYGIKKVPGVKGKILASIPACQPAKILGPLAVRSGAKAFIGSVDYMWAGMGPDIGWEGYNYAKDFVDTWVTFHTELIRTQDPEHALSVYKSKCHEYAEKYEAEKPDSEWEYHAWAMKENSEKIRLFWGGK